MNNTELNVSRYFLNHESTSLEEYQRAMQLSVEKISKQFSTQEKPYSGMNPNELADTISALNFFPEEGKSMEDVLMLSNTIFEDNIVTSNVNCLAHLHCPVLISSLAAEAIITAFNQSMDSWDQAPAATMLEQEFCNQLCALYKLGDQADGIFTSGGTMSNFMGMLIARDWFCKQIFNCDIQQDGLPSEFQKLRIVCSEYAHFSVTQSASILGLGANAVVSVKSSSFEEEIELLKETILTLKSQGLFPFVYVSTAGTTDYGNVGQLDKIAKIVHEHSMWMHVDAAYGGALITSETHKQKLNGIEHADSITVDFHKLFYQPISCGAFLVKNKEMFQYIKLNADYLNPEENEEAGIIDLVSKSIQTTRRFDALKPILAFQHLGIRNLGLMIDYTIELANYTSTQIDESSHFELATQPALNSVVFRYKPNDDLSEHELNNLNKQIKSRLLMSGEAIIGQTTINEIWYLKFTILNPSIQKEHILTLLHKIEKVGQELGLKELIG